MLKEIEKAKAGFEDFYDMLNARLGTIEDNKNAEKEAVIADFEEAKRQALVAVDEKYAEKERAFKAMLDECKEVETIEVPDEPAVDEQPQEVVEEQPL